MLPHFSIRFVLQITSYALVTATTYAQTIRYVSPTGPNANPAVATSWANSTTNLQGAINASQPGDQVWVAAGTYKPGGNTNTDRFISFSMKNGVAIYGGFVGTETALSQRPAINPVNDQPSSSTLSGEIGDLNIIDDNSYHVISNTGLDSTAILDGFVVTGGNANNFFINKHSGGGVYNNGSGSNMCSPLLRNCTFQYNSALFNGGAIYNDASLSGLSSPVLINCGFLNNATSYGDGGAMYNDGSSSGNSSPTLLNCFFLSNSTYNNGGAILNFGNAGVSSPKLTNCTFRGNLAYQGGGICNFGWDSGISSPLLTDCAFQSNTVIADGGSISNYCKNGISRPTLQNCSFTNNSAFHGGAISNDSYSIGTSSPLLTNCFFESNSASSGGAISNTSDISSQSNPVLNNCIFQSNTAPGLGGVINNINSSPLLTNCIFQSNTSYSGAISNFAHSGNSIPKFINCSFINNWGGAMSNNAEVGGLCSPILLNCSFQNNLNERYGGAMGNSSTSGGITHPKLTNCIFFNNGGNKTFSNLSATVTATYTLFESAAVEAVTGLDLSGPGNITNITLSPFASASTVTLAPCSSALNAGNPYSQTTISAPYTDTALPATDLIGNPRIIGNRVDMGAIEDQKSLSCPTRLYVNGNATGNGTGLEWNNAFTDLQTALSYPLSASLTEIWVASGIYKPTAITTSDSRTISFSMKNGVAIYGGFVGNETALSQRPAIDPVNGQPSSSTLSGEIGDPSSTTDNSYHVISNPSGLTTTSVLDGFVISSGWANGESYTNTLGGGVINYGNGIGKVCAPLFRNCCFQNNHAYDGGAVFNYSGYSGNSSPTFVNCSFQNNSATYGGAIYNGWLGTSSPLFINCFFLSNYAYQGGALFNSDDDCSPRLINCSFKNNEATAGGAILNNGQNRICNPILTNCVLFNNGGTNTFYNYLATITATYSLFEPSAVSGVAGLDLSGPGNLTNVTVSPFASATSVALAPNSPAINAGDPATSSATVGMTDLAGNPRFVGRIDMGAVEFQEVLEVYTLKDGSWSDPSVWSVGRLPQLGERVRLKHTVSIPSATTALGLVLTYDPAGKLVHEAGSKLQLGDWGKF